MHCIKTKGGSTMGRTANKDSERAFEDYFKRATSPMLVLYLLNEKPMYVYRLSQELEKRTNSNYKMKGLNIKRNLQYYIEMLLTCHTALMKKKKKKSVLRIRCKRNFGRVLIQNI